MDLLIAANTIGPEYFIDQTVIQLIIDVMKKGDINQ